MNKKCLLNVYEEKNVKKIFWGVCGYIYLKLYMVVLRQTFLLSLLSYLTI